MEQTELVLYGASGHAKVILDAAKESNIKVIGFFDDYVSKNVFKGVEVHPYSEELYVTPCLISIGDNKLREQVSRKIKHLFGRVIAKSSLVANSVEIAHGTFVAQRAVIQTDSRVGAHVIVNTNSSVDHDCTIRDYVHIAPGATICGGVQIGEGSFIGAGAVILPNVSIGKWCIIGAGSVVTKNVSDFSTIKGNPAK
ncbi:acetyltransferase [Jiulongibacter sediminis]|uniref:acetyltransferase n=1 Tax=Jiulongibacter sediminis TaxID=1605367 RepID=UPI0026ED30A2|nr:acetyltransferase [Jiulongibacter sediminis]